MHDLTPINSETGLTRPFEVLTNVREESVWLSNFTSKNTRDTYRNAVVDFLAFQRIQSPEELYTVKQAHITAWRESMVLAKGSPANHQNTP